MKRRRARFTIEYEVDLDMIPGWGYQVSDWEDLAKADVLNQKHYNTTAKTTQIEIFLSESEIVLVEIP